MSDLCDGCAEYRSQCVCDTPQPQKGVRFTPDSLAVALHGFLVHRGPCPSPDRCAVLIEHDKDDAAAIIKIAVDALRDQGPGRG